MTESTEPALRTALVETCRALDRLDLNRGTAGNASVRLDGGFLVTPSAIPSETMEPGDVVWVGLAPGARKRGRRRPSSEWRIHRDILRTRPELNAVVHTHSPHASALSTLREPIPAFHYMVALSGGTSIRCADYATFGTQQLSDNVLAALEGRRCCLMSNHGALAAGESLEEALALSVEVESLARQLIIARGIGEPVVLDETEMERVLAAFERYRGR